MDVSGAEAEAEGPGAARPTWRRLLDGWMVIAARFGHVQTLMLLVLVYGILMGPVALGIAIGRRDFLGKRGLRSAGSVWRDADTAKPDLERAKLLS